MNENATLRSIRVPDELWNILKQQADRMGLTMNAFIVTTLWDVAKKNN